MRKEFYKEFDKWIGSACLNLGCGQQYEEGWFNVDFNPESKADVNFDFRSPWPVESNSYDTVLASHVLEHFNQDDLFPIMFEIGRVLRPNGYLIALVPYGTSEYHFANPFHKFGWTTETMYQFDRTLYEQEGTASTKSDQMIPLQSWFIEHRMLTPLPEWIGKSGAEIEFARKHYINVIQEMSFVMKVRK